MAERAHPDDPGFQVKWQLKRRFGFIPYWERRKNPYLDEFMWRYSWVNRHCSGKDVLDIPCGMGWGTSLIRGARSLKGLDLNAAAIAEAQRRYGAHADFGVGDMSRLQLPDSSCDVICCLEGIEHVPVEVAQRFLAEAHRALRPNGLMLISSPYCQTKSHSGNPYHIHEYRPEEISAAVSRYFTIQETESRDVHILTVLYMNCRKKGLP
jgi:2-polyprenyl-3-methyl-5-hydroxy-6-metoxy-1,4-benzoquinol methylase